VIAPDLRGYGASTAPLGGAHGVGFSKREMANDLVELMGDLGFHASQSWVMIVAREWGTGWHSTTLRPSSGS